MSNHAKHSVVGSKPAASETEPHEYWTPERRAAAKPIPLPKVAKGDKKPGMMEAIKPRGEPGHVAPGRPKGHKHEAHAAPSHSGGSAVGRTWAYPFCTCGKLLFTQGGSDFSASASVVALNILLTAGHCVHNNGDWSTNVLFLPSYPEGKLHFSYFLRSGLDGLDERSQPRL